MECDNRRELAHQSLGQLRDEVICGWSSDMQKKLTEEKQELEKKLAKMELEKEALQKTYDELAASKEQVDRQLAGALRVLREKSNQVRDIRPKSRSGYILQGFEEQNERIITYDVNVSISVYRTILQTCYKSDFEFETVKDFVRHDLISGVLSKLALCDNDFVDMDFPSNPAVILEAAGDVNKIFRLQLRYYPYKGYYDVILYHTRPIGIIDPDLMPSLPESDKK